MCKMMEDMRNEALKAGMLETATKLVKTGKLSLEDIAECVPLVSMDELKEIEAQVMQLA